MSAQQSGDQASDLPFDRNTAIGIGSIAIAVLVLIALIGLITLLPAQTISQSIAQQTREQQTVLANSLAQEMETYFNSLAFDLVGLANRPEIRSTEPTSRDNAISMLDDLFRLRSDQITAIVRVGADGAPIYGWPDAVNSKIVAHQALDWKVSADWVSSISQQHSVQFSEQPSPTGGMAYLLAAPLTEDTDTTEVLVFELNLDKYFVSNFSPMKLSASGQLWIFDRFGNNIYSFRPQPLFAGDINKARNQTDTTLVTDYPQHGQESVIAPVFTGFSSTSAFNNPTPSLSIVLSRASTEGQEAVFSTLQSLFLFGVVIICFVVLFGVVIGRFLLRESNRRRYEEQRRATTRALLDMSHTLNSSLEINVVLDRILEGLSVILPHDTASIMLLNEEDRTVTLAAQRGEATFDMPSILPITGVRGAREVIMSGKPLMINDCLNDPRWTPFQGSPVRSWLGVPLRVRQETVGVLNICSFATDRFQPDDIEVAEAYADQAGVALQNARAHELEIRAYETELETAQAIQTSLLPQEPPLLPQLTLAAKTIPAKHVSGDYYQYYPLPDGRLGVAVGDVSGKGIPAALLMAVVTTALRDEILKTPAAGSLLNELNTDLHPRMAQNNMTSALLMSIFDPRTRRVEIANGGMAQPYLWNGATWDLVEVGGYPLGASLRVNYSAKTILMAPGSKLLIISDGILEAQNRSGEFFGFDRLEALLAELPKAIQGQSIIDGILAAVRQHLDGLDPQDDITLVIMTSVDAS